MGRRAWVGLWLLPGHTVVQAVFWKACPSQKAPPLSGAGLVQVRVRFCQPRPQRLEQGDHSAQLDQPPFTIGVGHHTVSMDLAPPGISSPSFTFTNPATLNGTIHLWGWAPRCHYEDRRGPRRSLSDPGLLYSDKGKSEGWQLTGVTQCMMGYLRFGLELNLRIGLPTNPSHLHCGSSLHPWA